MTYGLASPARIYRKALLRHEKIAHRFDIISCYYLRLYDELVEKEITMANISSEDFIFVIGCGSIPATPALIAMKTKARIVSIDKDLKAISRASKFIKTLDLQNVIKLEHADALYFPVENFDVIFVLYGVRQQKEILNYFSTRLTNGRTEGYNRKAKLIQRCAYGFRNFENYRLKLLYMCR